MFRLLYSWCLLCGVVLDVLCLLGFVVVLCSGCCVVFF